jgi:hypothetical protein
MKQEPTEATMRNCHGNAVGILVIYGEEDVKGSVLAIGRPCPCPLSQPASDSQPVCNHDD